MKKIVLLLVAPFAFLPALSAQITQKAADEIVLERMSQSTELYTIHAKGDAQTSMTISTAAGEILELGYKCWVYYIDYADFGSYLIVKENSGNLLEVNPKSNAKPANLWEWRVLSEGTPVAISDKTWTVTSDNGSIKQTWSDYLKYDGLRKEANETLNDALKDVTVGQGTGGVGDYRKNPNTDYYMYNWYYVVQNQDELCPSPWRVPTKQDILNLDLALGGLAANTERTATDGAKYMGAQANSEEVENHVKKYVNLGFEFSGRHKPGSTLDYFDRCGYIYTSEEANAEAKVDAPGVNKGSHLALKNGTQDRFTVFPQNEYDTSQTKSCALPVRCVKNAK